MSLEQNIAELNTNIKALIAAMAARTGTGETAAEAKPLGTMYSPESPEAPTEAKKPTAKKEAGEVKKPAATASSPSGATPETTAQAESVPAGDAPTYDQVKDRILTLSKEKGREPTVALMQRHGVSKGPDLKPEQYADFIKDVNAILAGTYDPEAAELA